MFAMIEDSLLPLLFIWGTIVSMIMWRKWPKVQRVWRLISAMPSEVRAAWHNQPSPRGQTTTFLAPSQQAEVVLDQAANDVAVPMQPLIRLERVPGGGTALMYPPSLQLTLKYMRETAPDGRYLFPYGWFLHIDQSTGQGVADLAFTDLTESYNIAVVGPQQYGKTSLIFAAIMALTFQHSPRELQFAIFDLKNIDFPQMEDSAYTHLMVRHREQIADAVKALTAEIERRGKFLRDNKLSNWKNYQGKDLPLLVVYISELSTMSAVIGKEAVDKLLDDLMGIGAAFGLRSIIDTHSLANYSTTWRSLLSERLLGPGLSNPQHDLVNSDMPTSVIQSQGAVPPSQLRKGHPGVFTAISDSGQAVTLRMVYVPDEIRQRWLAQLPQRRQDSEIEAIEQAATGQAEPAQEQSLAPQSGFAGKAADLYKQGIDLAVILRQPHVRDELRQLALSSSNRHSKTNAPNVRKITRLLFGVEKPSGTQQPMVSDILVEMGLLQEEQKAEQMAESTVSAIAA